MQNSRTWLHTIADMIFIISFLPQFPDMPWIPSGPALRTRCCFLQISAPVGVLTEWQPQAA